MAEIQLATRIAAPPARVFDLSRSIDFHCHSASDTSEKAVHGVTAGLIGPGEEVTWRARHFFVWQQLTVKITSFDRPQHFRDEQVKGAFRWMKHDHYFEKLPNGEGTLMRDVFGYVPPFGIIGTIVDAVFLKHYFRRFLIKRNSTIKQAAESDAWKSYINENI